MFFLFFQSSQREMRDVIVFDRTQSTTLIKFWDFDWIHLADDWTPMKQVEGAVTNDDTKTREG